MIWDSMDQNACSADSDVGVWNPRVIAASRQASRTERSPSTISRFRSVEWIDERGWVGANIVGAEAAVIIRYPALEG